MKGIWLRVLGAVATASGCAYQGAYYESTQYPSNQPATPPVSTYPVPQNDPKGSVHVISLGAERLPVPAGQPDTYLHLRIAAENRADEAPWTVDPNDQSLTVGGATVPPSFAEASGGGPVLTVQKGAQGYLDVFDPAPAAGGPTRVTMSWRVRRGNEAVAGTTDFDRVAAPDTAYARYEPVHGPHVHVGVGLGWWGWPHYYAWGGPWWGSPYWWYHPRFYGYYGGYYGGHHGRYYGRGYYGGRGVYSGGRVYSPSTGTWRGGGGSGATAPRGGNSGSGNSGRSNTPGGWRGGRR